MNESGDDFFPRAVLSGDEDSAVASPDDVDEVEHGAHLRAAADDDGFVRGLKIWEHCATLNLGEAHYFVGHAP
jgi:hypothetical protein